MIANATGTTGSSDVKNIAVSCKTNANPALHTIGGNVSGIALVWEASCFRITVAATI